MAGRASTLEGSPIIIVGALLQSAISPLRPAAGPLDTAVLGQAKRTSSLLGKAAKPSASPER